MKKNARMATDQSSRLIDLSGKDEGLIVLVTFALTIVNFVGYEKWMEYYVLLMIGKLMWNITSMKYVTAMWRSYGLYCTQIVLFFKYIGFITTISFYFTQSLLLSACTVTAALIILFPIPSSPGLSGKHKVGTLSFLLPREGTSGLPVQCWFPVGSESTVGKKSALIWTSGSPTDEVEELVLLLDQLADYSKMPRILSRHLLLARSNSLWQKDLKNLANLPSYKVAIYSHGMYGWRQVHSSCCEKLASFGFLVFSCDHAPDAMISRPPGKLNASCIFNFHLPKEYNVEQERRFYGNGLNRRVEDIRALVSFLSLKNTTDHFTEVRDKLDMKQLYCWGHSFGGATMTAYCCQYPEVAKVEYLLFYFFPFFIFLDFNLHLLFYFRQ